MKTVQWLSDVAACFCAGGFASAQSKAPARTRIYVNAKVWTADDAKAIGAGVCYARRTNYWGGNERRNAGAGGTGHGDGGPCKGNWSCRDSTMRTGILPRCEMWNWTAQPRWQRCSNCSTAAAKAHPGESWITGRGWGYDVFPGTRAGQEISGRDLAGPAGVYLGARRTHGACEFQGAGACGNYARDEGSCGRAH